MNKFERRYTPAVYKALQSQIKEYTVVLKNDGIEAAKRKLNDIDKNWKIAPVIKDMYKTVGVFYANQEYGQLRQQLKDKKKGFGFNAEFVAELIRYFTLDLLNKAVLPISATTREQVRQVLEQATNEGWGVDQTVRALQSSDLTLWRARMIVRTETQKAAFKGRKMGADKIEYATTTEWIAANDHRTRHSHRRVDGDVVDPYQKFKVPVFKGDLQIGEETMEGPGDPKASAGNVINCRCTSASRIKYDEKGNPILKRGASPVLQQRFFENGGGEKPIMSSIRSMTGTNSADDLSGLDDILLNAIHRVQSRNRYFKFSGIVKNDRVSLLGVSSDNELNIGKRFNKDEIEKAAFLSKAMANRKNYSSASKLINEINSGASEYAEFIIEHELNHVKQNYLNAAAKGGWGDEIEKRAKKWQKGWVDSIGKDEWYPSDYANAIRDISVKEKEWLAESYLLFKNNPELIKSDKISGLMKEFDNLINDMANAR
jgi:hypothetical protein